MRNYSKNVKDLYMPGGPRSSKSQKRTEASTDGRSAYLNADSDTVKEIRPRLRSGAAQDRLGEYGAAGDNSGAM